MEYLRTRLVERHTAATEVLTKDLPVNAMSHLVISLDAYNATDEATLAEMLVFINNVQVSQGGVTVVDLQSEDLYGVDAYLLRKLPTFTGRLATDNLHRALTLIVPFGRKLFDPEECFPAQKKGELTLRVDMTAPATAADNGTISIDAVELPGASPRRFLKTYRKALSAPGSTGWDDVELAIGNDLVCCQIRMATVPAASSHTYGVDAVKLMRDNQEHVISAADVMCLMGERMLRVGAPNLTIAAQGLSPLELMVWLDLDPNSDGKFLVDTAGASSVKLGLNYGVDEALNLTVLELVDVH